MLITLMGIALMVIGIIIVWICIKVPKFKKVGKYFGIVFLAFGFAWTAIVFEIIGLQRIKEDSEIANNQKEYVMLCSNIRLLEANPDDEAKDTIIESVNNWNEQQPTKINIITIAAANLLTINLLLLLIFCSSSINH